MQVDSKLSGGLVFNGDKVFVENDDLDGEPKSFTFKNNVNAHFFQYNKPEVRLALQYNNSDLWKMTEGVQPLWEPRWNQPTFLSQEPPLRGIDIMRPGARGYGDGLQTIVDPANHYFRVLVDRIYPIVEEQTAMKFFFGKTSREHRSDYWLQHEIKFDDVTPNAGTMKQSHRVVSYYVRTIGGQKKATGYAVRIPWEYMLKTWKGKYSIDKFIVHEIVSILRNIMDFQYIVAFEGWHKIGDPFQLFLEERRKQYDSFDKFMEFYNETFGILNTNSNSVSVERQLNSMEILMTKILNRIHRYNPTFPNQKTVGLMMDLDIAHEQIHHPHNAKFLFVGEKTGTFRNEDAKGDRTKQWESNYLGGKSVIFGISSFSDEKNPEGLSPFKTLIRLGYMALFPKHEEVFDKSNPDKYSINNYSLKVACAPKNSEGFNLETRFVHYPQVLEMVPESAFNAVIMTNSPNSTFESILNGSIGSNKAKEYVENLVNSVFSLKWRPKTTTKTDWSDFFYGLSLKIQISGFEATFSENEEIATIIKFLNDIKEFFKDFYDGDEKWMDAFSIAMVGLFVQKDLRNRIEESDFVTYFTNHKTDMIQKYPVFSEFNPDSTKIHYTTKNGLNLFDGMFSCLKDFKKVKFKTVKKLIESHGIPPFFQIVLLRFEDFVSDCVFVATQNFGTRTHVAPITTYKTNQQLLEAVLTFKVKVGFILDTADDGIRVENVHIKRIPEHTLGSEIPKKNDDYYKAMIFPIKCDLKNVYYFFHNCMPEAIMNRISSKAYEVINPGKINDYAKLQRSQDLENFEDHEYYLDNRKWEMPKKPFMCWKGGYWKYTKSTHGWDEMVGFTGPMSKFYSMK